MGAIAGKEALSPQVLITQGHLLREGVLTGKGALTNLHLKGNSCNQKGGWHKNESL